MTENLSRIAKISGSALFLILLFLVLRDCNTPDIFYEPFNGPGLPSGWQTTHTDVPGDWTWTPDGTASGGQYWGNRSPIQSQSRGGAAVFNSDSLAAGTLPQHAAQLTSPTLRMTKGYQQVFLSFNLYYRKHQGQARVWVYGDSDGSGSVDSWIDITNNPKVGYDLTSVFAEQETDADDRYVYDISQYAAGRSGVKIRFTFDGPLYFWIIDDVLVGPGYTLPGGIEIPNIATPTTLEQVLVAKGIPAESDGQGGFYVPDELVVYWDTNNPDGSTITPQQKTAVRNEFGVDTVVTCPCDNRLELWGVSPTDPNLPGPGLLGDTIGLQGLKDGATSKSETMGVDYNYYNLSKGDLGSPQANEKLNPLTLAPRIPAYSADPVVIAILDTGVDYFEVDLMRNIWRNDSTSTAGPEDVIGWDFISGHENPADNHPDKHGTNVARVVLREMLNSDVDFRIMPVKTHDGNGLSNLFYVSCGTFYAVKEGADVINQSWGWYGDSNSVLKVALLEALEFGVTVTTVAGNQGWTLNPDTLIYPACYDSLPNLLAVASILVDPETGDLTFSNFSNSSEEYFDLATPGQRVYVLGTSMPSRDSLFAQLQEKDDNITGVSSLINGTSFSAPYVAALAARARALGNGQPWVLLRQAAKQASTNNPEPALQGKVSGGAYIHDSTPTEF